MVKKLTIFCLFWMVSFSVTSQKLMSSVSLNTKTVYIGQPVEMKVSVFTTTWFTAGVDVGNINVDGALTVYFRSLSTSKMVGNQRYSGVEFYYNLFPTKSGVIEVPVLEINVESPEEGGYKGIKRVIKTKPKSLTVNPIPLGYNANNWLVASSLSVRESWSQPLTNVKVGDVLQRTITRSANGTVSEFIPATLVDSASGVSLYPKRPKVNTHKSKTGVSATRSETVNYLFEKEGVVTLPAVEYVYWNSVYKKSYKKRIDSIRIEVKPNADLAMLETIKKSLQKEKLEEEKADEPFLILGFPPKTFAEYVIFGLLGIGLFYKILIVMVNWIKKKRVAYLGSERYFFGQLKKAVHIANYGQVIIASKSWLVKVDLPHTSLTEAAKKYKMNSLIDVLNSINTTIFKEKSEASKSQYDVLLQQIILLRKQVQSTNSPQKKAERTHWLNP